MCLPYVVELHNSNRIHVKNEFFLPTATARVAPVPEATPALRVAPGAATVPGAALGLPVAPQRGGHQGARLLPDPPPGPSLAQSPAPGLAHAHLLLLRTNSLAPALVPALDPVHVPAPSQQTANIEICTHVGRKIDLVVAHHRPEWWLVIFVFLNEGEKIAFDMASSEIRS